MSEKLLSVIVRMFFVVVVVVFAFFFFFLFILKPLSLGFLTCICTDAQYKKKKKCSRELRTTLLQNKFKSCKIGWKYMTSMF